MMQDIPCVQLSNLQVDHSGKAAFKNLNLNIDISAVTAFTGSKPAYWNTLLRTMAGMLPYQEGQVKLWGVPVDQIPRRNLSSQVCFVPQQMQTYFPYSVFDVIMQGCEPRLRALQSPDDNDRKLAEMLMQKLQISKLINRECNNLTAADRQRVLICRALMQDARLMLFEEPIQGLAIEDQQQISSLFRDLACQGGKTIVMTFENPRLALEISDQLVIFDDHGITNTLDRRHPQFLENAKTAIELMPIAVSESVHGETENVAFDHSRRIQDLF